MGRSLVPAMALVAASSLAFAQQLTTGTIAGTVAERSGAVVQAATITVTGPQGSRSTRTDNRGRFSVHGLAPAEYAVRIEAPGHAAVLLEHVLVSVDRRTFLPVRLDAPPPDSSRQEGTSLAAAWFPAESLVGAPVGNDLHTLIGLATVADGGFPDLGAVNPTISGASGLENIHIVDGVDLTETGYGALGNFSPLHGSLGAGVTGDLVEEVEVATGGFGAALGDAGGGVANAVLRSGSSRFGLDAAWYESPSSLEGDETAIVLKPNAAARTAARRRDLFLAVSGPAVRDRLYFFAAYAPVRIAEDFSLVSGDPSFPYFINDEDRDGHIDATPSYFSAGATVQGTVVPSSVTRERIVRNYAAKVTGFAGRNHKLELIVFGDPSDGNTGPQQPLAYLRTLAAPLIAPDPSTTALGLEWGGRKLALRHQACWSPHVFTEIAFSRSEDGVRETGPGTEFRSILDTRNDHLTGGAGVYYENGGMHDRWSAEVVHLAGPAELRWGLQYDDLEFRQPERISGPPYTAFVARFVDHVPVDLVDNVTGAPHPDGVQDRDSHGDPVFSTGLVGDGSLSESYTQVVTGTGAALETNGATFDVWRAGLGPSGASTTSTEKAAFVQATWNVRPNLTLRAGLRWTRQEIAGEATFTLPLAFFPDGMPTGVGSTTFWPSRHSFPGEYAPRIGLSWDVRSDGTQKAYIHCGRYFQRVPNDLAVRLLSSRLGVEGESFLDSDLIAPDMSDVCLASSGAPGGLYDSEVSCHRIQSLTATTPGMVLNGSIDPDRDGVPNARTRLAYDDEFLVGYAWSIADRVSVEARALWRSLGRGVEDLQFTSAEQLENLLYGRNGVYPGVLSDPFPGHGATGLGPLVLANPGDNVSAAMFPKPSRDYLAIETIGTLLPAAGWQARLGYRWSRLEGNYPGSYRIDNGQADPFNTSLYDFPAASAVDSNADGKTDTYVTSGLLAGQYARGRLDIDRTHLFDAFVSRQFPSGLNLGARLAIASGRPRVATLAHPVYRDPGEIPGRDPLYWWLVGVDLGRIDPVSGTVIYDGVRDGYGVFSDPNPGVPYPAGQIDDFDGDDVPDRVVGTTFRTGPRLLSYVPSAHGDGGWTESEWSLDLHISWDLALRAGRSSLTLLGDVFNVLGRSAAVSYDDTAESAPGAPNPNAGRVTAYQAPRSIRVGARFAW